MYTWVRHFISKKMPSERSIDYQFICKNVLTHLNPSWEELSLYQKVAISKRSSIYVVFISQ